MTLEQFWTILVKRRKFIVICFIVVGLGSYIGSKLLTPLYQSTALIQVAVSLGDTPLYYDSLLASSELVQTEAQLATSDPVLREVASHYPGLTVEQLASEVTSTVKLNTQLVEIDVTDPNPTRAAHLADDIAATMIKPQLQEVLQVNGRYQQQVRQDMASTLRQINTTTAELAALQVNGGSQIQIYALQAQLSSLQQQYNQWQLTLAQLEATKAQNANFLRVVQPAQPGLFPVSPRIQFNTGCGLAVGLCLGVLLALMFEQLDAHVRTVKALSQLLDWPVLATLWQAPSSKKEDVFNPTGHNINIEPYNILHTNIEFTGIDRSLHSLMVTSAIPSEGKSIIAANLAIFMARAGKTTLLIDANLRHPTQHDLFGLSEDKMGFSNAALELKMPGAAETPPFMSDMSGIPVVESGKPGTNSSQQFQHLTLRPEDASTTTNLSLTPFVHVVGIPNLWVMPSGPLPPNPPELLDSKAMQRLLKVIAHCGAEVVIFDTPPLEGLSDASILASKVDGVLVVVDTALATKNKLKQLKMMLSQTGINVLGCVVNKSPYKPKDSIYYYYTENQNGREKTVKNEYLLSIPVTPLSKESVYTQNSHLNSSVDYQQK